MRIACSVPSFPSVSSLNGPVCAMSAPPGESGGPKPAVGEFLHHLRIVHPSETSLEQRSENHALLSRDLRSLRFPALEEKTGRGQACCRKPPPYGCARSSTSSL